MRGIGAFLGRNATLNFRGRQRRYAQVCDGDRPAWRVGAPAPRRGSCAPQPPPIDGVALRCLSAVFVPCDRFRISICSVPTPLISVVLGVGEHCEAHRFSPVAHLQNADVTSPYRRQHNTPRCSDRLNLPPYRDGILATRATRPVARDRLTSVGTPRARA